MIHEDLIEEKIWALGSGKITLKKIQLLKERIEILG